MIGSVFIVGGILTFAVVVINLILLKATAADKFISYFPNHIFVAAGLILLLVATFVNESFAGAPLGGWGIASLFAAAIGYVITAIIDAYMNADENIQNA
ncbi:hypothetical protein [Oceanobacillus chungangensis]|uniref:DUF2512 domain-containing protein n=1 Tax=Oceanobacillus chungangensis TaxID=1229152 RepID=A0A3D8PK37_9BACI|nr:hypothetical protein [Oceanobacillus chungangensis]RDW15591.1 hypothetical protein CWR45_17610 [Oceanobacillus chungangensis]